MGIVICILSGIFSACGNLGFVYGGSITAKAIESGVPADRATNAVWALLTIALFICNVGYSVVLMKRNGTAKYYRQPGTSHYFVLGALMGALWMAGFSLYGVGATMLAAGRIGWQF